MDPRQSDRLSFLGTLAAGLAHEIQNPLGTMKLNLQLLAEEFEEKDRRAHRRISTCLDEARRLEEVVQDFLRFARGCDLEKRPTSIQRLLTEVLDFFLPQAHARRIQIRTTWDEGLPEIEIDPDRTKQAILNLVLNASQAMPEGGELLVRTRREGESVRIDLTDTGEGMTPEVLAKCFNVYYSTKRSGTGLGLPTTRRIVEEHGGSIEIQSESGHGTNVILRLPCPAA